MLHWCIFGILLRHLHPDKPTIIQEGCSQPNVVANVIAPSKVSRVLDIGCGTGIWTLDIAERYPGSFVEGIDLVGAQPRPLSNTQWRTPRAGHEATIDFDEPRWRGIQAGRYSLIHSNQLCGSITSWDNFIRNCYDALTPGGWYESFEIDFEPCCDDGTLPTGSALNTWWYFMTEAMSEKPLRYPAQLPDRLRQTGFSNVQRITLPLPANDWVDPLNIEAWLQAIMTRQLPGPYCDQLWLPPADWVKRVKDVSQYMPLVLQNSPDLPFVDTFGGLTMAPFTRNLGWRRSQVDALVNDVMACCSNRAYHVYFKL